MAMHGATSGAELAGTGAGGRASSSSPSGGAVRIRLGPVRLSRTIKGWRGGAEEDLPNLDLGSISIPGLSVLSDTLRENLK
jgi:hypothetical protein